jgi:hypothetical protein
VQGDIALHSLITKSFENIYILYLVERKKCSEYGEVIRLSITISKFCGTTQGHGIMPSVQGSELNIEKKRPRHLDGAAYFFDN